MEAFIRNWSPARDVAFVGSALLPCECLAQGTDGKPFNKYTREH